VQKMVRDAEYHALVLANDLGEGRFVPHSIDIYDSAGMANALIRRRFRILEIPERGRRKPFQTQCGLRKIGQAIPRSFL
jgi:hypothetical protein